MAVKRIYDTEAEIPAHARPEYKEQDGKFVLDLEDYEDPIELKTALATERGRLTKAENGLKAWTNTFKDKTPAQIQTELARIAELERQSGGTHEEIQAAVKRATDALEEAQRGVLGEKDTRITKLSRAVDRRVRSDAVTKLLAELGATKSGMRTLPALMMSRIKLDERETDEDLDYGIVVIDQNGNPAYDTKAQAMTLDQLGAEFVKEFPDLFKGEHENLNGGGATKTSGKAPGKWAGRKRSDLTMDEKVQAQDDLGFDGYMQLPA